MVYGDAFNDEAPRAPARRPKLWRRVHGGTKQIDLSRQVAVNHRRLLVRHVVTTLRPGQVLCHMCVKDEAHRREHGYYMAIKSVHLCNACESFHRRMSDGEFPCQNIGCGDPKTIELFWIYRKVGNRTVGKERKEARASDRELRAHYSWKLRKANRINPYGLWCFGRAFSFHCTRQDKAWPAPVELRDHNIRAKYAKIEQQLSPKPKHKFHRRLKRNWKEERFLAAVNEAEFLDLFTVSREQTILDNETHEAKLDEEQWEREAQDYFEEETRRRDDRYHNWWLNDNENFRAYKSLYLSPRPKVVQPQSDARRIVRTRPWRDIPHKTLNQAGRGRDQLDLDNNDEDAGDDSVPPSDKRRLEEEADLDRLIDKERTKNLTEASQPSPNDDVAHCEPPQVTRGGKTVTVLQRDPDAQRQFGATLRAKHRKEAPLRYWERTPERRPAKSSKHDEGDDH